MSERREDFDQRGCGEDIAPYLLGALSEAEFDAFERHLLSCSLCAEDIKSLGAVMSQLPLAVPQVTAPRNIKRRLMATVEAEAELLAATGEGADRAGKPAPASRRRLGLGGIFPRPAFAAGIAATALACGVVGGVVLTSGDNGAKTGVRTLAADVSGSNGRATLELGHESNTLRVSDMPSPPANRVYQVWLQRAGEAPNPTNAMFTVDRHGNGTVAVPGSLKGVDQILVTAEPRGGSQVPTRLPVITAHLDDA
jgi:hypothetical protein